MDDVMLEFSLVLAANSHNPTILNKDWLAKTDIVPTSWGWELASQPISTPPLAQISYISGVSLTLDPGRLVIRTSSDFDKCYDPILEIARRYVSTLSHIPYTAVGTNFKAFVACDNAKARIVEAFIKSGPWIGEQDFTSTLKFIYRMENCIRNVSLEPGEYVQISKKDGSEGRLKAISLDFNYHREYDPNDVTNSMLEALGNFQNDFDDRSNYIEMIKNSIKCEN